MKRAVDWEQNTLISELNLGKELAKQLQNHLNAASSLETREILIDEILSCYDRSLSMLNWDALGDNHTPYASSMEPQYLDVNNSPRSNRTCKGGSKKRKTQQRWTERLKVCSESDVEGPLEDGHSWRKYGQKDILGSRYPRHIMVSDLECYNCRAYYRCTHRHTQGCLANKQVQRSDEDPNVFEVNYKGRHTCLPVFNPTTPSPSLVNKRPKHIKVNRQEHLQQSEEVSEVKTDDLDIRGYIFPSFPFENKDEDNNFFGESLMTSNFLGSISPSFVSPATSDSDYYSPPRSHVHNFGATRKVQTSESDLTETISAPTSVTNSPIGEDLNFSNMCFDADLLFDDLECFA
ncbi:hypothetical protein K2173_025289 [Erythroxylum novogranatense]|uniref:WRKY domain-containing protein n=1 Tax=Erythroxylum novogranatense TaxID=1862640 RepID=A0AAV8UGU1_9ROSI|nr:hypothetical protein K2173_025289 [Erythroxylum novogranatense]